MYIYIYIHICVHTKLRATSGQQATNKQTTPDMGIRLPFHQL